MTFVSRSTTSARKVSLEFLRAGPAHNHLLSPLTPYLAVCGNHRASLVHVPWEHAQLERRMLGLRYVGEEHSPERARERLALLDQTGNEVAQLLSAAQGLASGLTFAHSMRANSADLAHLEVVVSANEMAWIPFEFAKVPTGAPGGDNQWLLLQTQAPTVLTRRIRGVEMHDIRWPSRLRILFAWAAPEQTIVPAQEHLNALIEAIAPWLGFRQPDQSAANWLASHLTMLPQASLRDIHEACREHAYTHVHLLAHGLRDERAPDQGYSLALHASTGSPQRELVDGARLAAALQGAHAQGPVIVSVASCDSGQSGDIVQGGASLVHQIHASGVPFVLGSQFPLSFAGSVIATSKLYASFAQGMDPRDAVWRARHALHAFFAGNNHDWASLVAYGSLPEDLPSQLLEVSFRATKGKLDALLNRCDGLSQCRSPAREAEIDTIQNNLVELLEDLPNQGPLLAQAEALQGAIKKRLAQRAFLSTQPGGYFPSIGESQADVAIFCAVDRPSAARAAPAVADDQVGTRHREAMAWMHQALEHYWQAARHCLARDGKDDPRRPIPLHWPLVQQLCMAAALGRPLHLGGWEGAALSIELELDRGSPRQDLEAHGSAIELYLIRLAYGGQSSHPLPLDEARRRLQFHADQVLMFPERTLVHFTTYLQLKRYALWWTNPEWHQLVERFVARNREVRAGAPPPVWAGDAATEVMQRANDLTEALLERGLVDPSGTWKMR